MPFPRRALASSELYENRPVFGSGERKRGGETGGYEMPPLRGTDEVLAQTKCVSQRGVMLKVKWFKSSRPD